MNHQILPLSSITHKKRKKKRNHQNKNRKKGITKQIVEVEDNYIKLITQNQYITKKQKQKQQQFLEKSAKKTRHKDKEKFFMASLQKECGTGCKKKNCSDQESLPSRNDQKQKVEEQITEQKIGIKEEAGRFPIEKSPQKQIFKIEGMCCASEINSLKQMVNPLINGTDANLTFDLINAKLILESKQDNLPTNDQVIKAIAKTGMTAVLWNDHIKQEEKQTFWQKNKHVILNIISAAGLIVGLVLHVVRDGIGAAIGEGVGEEKNERPDYPPISTMVIYSISIVAGGWFIFRKAIIAVRRLRPDPNLLMTIATLGAIGVNAWLEATLSMYLFSVAGYVEAWNMERARKAIRVLMELAPTTAHVLHEDGTVSEQLVEQIPVDTIITVKPGAKIPMDSKLIWGSTSVNQAPITGESMPVQKEIGDMLFAGTINGDGAIQCRITKAASDSTLANIIRKVQEAQSRRARSDQWVEKFSHYYIPAVTLASVIVAIVPPLASGGNSQDASTWYPWIYKGLELLVISCPCSLVISTPVSIVAGLTAAARSGVLIKGGIFLETAAYIQVFAMDKTGTLTNGEPVVQDIIPFDNYTVQSLLQLAASLEVHSDHPLARAVQRKAKADDISYQSAEDFQIHQGKGAEGQVNGELFWIGSHKFLHEKTGDKEPAEVHEQIKQLENSGRSIVAIGIGKSICGFIGIADSIRAESRSAIQELKQAGIKRVVMLTGDNEGAAKMIAGSIGIEYYAELLPENKIKHVEELLAKYKIVAMVGDGINDAPAMAIASLGIALGVAGSDAAIETADITLMSDDLGKLPWLIKHSRHTLYVIKQNVVFSLTVKAIFTVLIFVGYTTLWMAILSDIGATFIVVSNALRLVNNKAGPRREENIKAVREEIKSKQK